MSSRFAPRAAGLSRRVGGNENIWRRRILSVVIASMFAPRAGVALALPTGGEVAAGSATISQPGANHLRIDQSSASAILNWQSFSIGANQSVVFAQPSASAVALNRVLGNSASEIFGSLSANGRVFLVNPNGILFGPGASVDVGGFVASTLSIKDSDFLAGRYVFAREGAAGSIVNRGTINAASGFAALVAPSVTNEGLISARLGSVAVGAGDRVTLDLAGDGLINVKVDEAALNASIVNKGTIAADGGRVVLSVRSANALLDTVLNVEGTVRATTMVERNGVIRLEGGEAGVVNVSGTLEASGRGAGEKGGSIAVLGDMVGLFGSARVDASGDAGGGSVLVGGNFQGQGPEQNAFASYVGKDVTISADALTSGNGGKVIVWADHATRFGGTITARGGSQGGDGGFVEVSGKETLNFYGFVDARAPFGKIGTLLLDPKNITVANGGSAALTAVDQFGDGGGTSNETIAPATINAAGANVVLQANNDITVNDPIAMTGSGITLTLRAGRDINVNANVSTTNGAIGLTANDSGATLANRDAGAGDIVMAAGTTLNAGTAGTTLTIGTLSTAGGISAMGLISTGGAITLTGDSIDLLGGANSVSSTGALTLQPVTAGVSIGVGTGAAGTLSIDDTDLAALANGFSSITIGRSTGTHAITVNAHTFTDPVTLRASGAGGAITVNGALATGSAAGETGAIILTSGSGGISLNAGLSTTNQAITLNAGTGTLTQNAGATLSSGSGAVSLTGDTLDLAATISGTGTLTLAPASAARTVGIADGAAGGFNLTSAELNLLQNGFSSITVGHSSGTGAVDVQAHTFTDPVTLRASGAGGAITVNGALATGSAAGETGAIILTSGSGGISLNAGLSTTNQAITLNAGTGTLTQNAGATLSSGSGAVSLTGDTLDLAATISGTGTLTLAPASAARTVGIADGAAGGFNLTSAELNLLQNGFSSITVGHSSGTGAVDVQAHTFTDPVTLRASGAGGAITVNGALATGSAAGETGAIILTSGSGGISLNAGLSTTNQAITLNAGTGTLTQNAGATLSSGSGAVSLTGDTLDLAATISGTGTLTLAPASAARTVGIADGAAGGFNLTSAELNLLQNGFSSITVGHSSGTGAVDVQAHTFTDPVTLRASGAGGAITVNGALATGSAAGETGAIILTSGSGGISLNAGLSTTNQAITLNAGTGTLTQNAGATLSSGSGAVSLTGDTLDLAATISGTGTLTLAPASAARTVGIADGAAGGFNLTSAELNLLQNGFSSITVGHSSGTGAVDVQAHTFTDPVTLRASGAGGAITVNGALATGSAAGETGAIILTSGSGGISLNAGLSTTNQAITLNAGTGTLTQNAGATLSSGSGAVSLTGDTLDLAGGPNSISGTSTILLQPAAAARPIVIGAPGTATDFALDISEIAALTDGFSGITIGRSSGTHAITVNAVTFNDSVTIQSPSGAGTITVAGALSTAPSNSAITLTAGTGNSGILTLASGGSIASGSGAITLTADSIDLGATANTITGTGTITLQPVTSARPIVIGAAGAASDFALSATEIATLTDGFSDITIGRSSGTHAITVNAATFTDAVTIQAPSGRIIVAGPITGTGNASIRLDSSQAVGQQITLNAGITTAGQLISLDDVVLGANVVLDTTNAGGSPAGADITFRTTTINADSAANNRALTLTAGTGGTVTLPSTVGETQALGALTVSSANTMTVSAVTTTGNIVANAQNGITLNGAIDAGLGTVTIAANQDGAGAEGFSMAAGSSIATTNATAGAVTINVNAAGGGTGAAALRSITTGSGGTLTVATSTGNTGGGSITQAQGTLLNAGAASFTAGAAAITLTNAGNDFTGAVSLTGGTTQVTDANALTLGTLDTGALTVTATGALNLGQGTVGGALSATSNSGAITQADALAITGPSNINAGAGVITLANAGNDFIGAVSLNNSGANDVAVTDTNAIVLGTSGVGMGTLTVNAVGITQTGAITQAAGSGAATFNAGAGAITLTNAGNDFTGAVSLTGGTTQVTDANALTLGTLDTGALTVTATGALNLGQGTVGGALSATSNSGAITQADALAITGPSNINAGAGVITLTNAGNDFIGAVSLNNSGANDVAVTDTNAIVLGTSGCGHGHTDGQCGGHYADRGDHASGGLGRGDV